MSVIDVKVDPYGCDLGENVADLSFELEVKSSQDTGREGCSKCEPALSLVTSQT